MNGASARDPVEAEFLAMLQAAPEDDTTRLVYADWLEARGERERADFLRTVCKLAGRVHRKKAPQLRERLVKLSTSSEVAWRAAVARPPLEKCTFELAFECPRQWTALAVTDVPTVRHCSTCERDVHFCGTLDEIRAHAREGSCVAFDPALRSTEAMTAYNRERPPPDLWGSGDEIVMGELA